MTIKSPYLKAGQRMIENDILEEGVVKVFRKAGSRM
jgi:hypothetical protein